MASERTRASHWSEVDVAGALKLRRWALRTLAAADAEAFDATAGPPSQSLATWGAFLEAEMCALPLTQALSASQRAALPPDVATILERRSAIEIKRVLAARGQLRAISDLAADQGLRVMALKGAVAVAAGFDLDLVDLDFLLPPDDARRLADALMRAGYRSERGGSPRHFGMLYMPGGIGVEIHTTLSRGGEPVADALWAATVPAEGLAGLQRLKPAEHLWHLLWHAALDHPDRLGRIRDLLLTAHAVGECSAGDLDALNARIERNALAVELRQQLGMAIDLREHRPIEDDLWRSAAAAYAGRRAFEGLPIPRTQSFIVWRWTLAFLGGPLHRRELWRETLAPRLALSRYPFIAFVEQRAPRVGSVFFLVLRLIRLPIILAAAAPLAGYVRLSLRHLERQYLRSE